MRVKLFSVKKKVFCETNVLHPWSFPTLFFQAGQKIAQISKFFSTVWSPCSNFAAVHSRPLPASANSLKLAMLALAKDRVGH